MDEKEERGQEERLKYVQYYLPTNGQPYTAALMPLHSLNKERLDKQDSPSESSPLPTVTHLHFAVLHYLTFGEESGINIRIYLSSIGWNKSLAAFYQLMDRLWKAGHIEQTNVTRTSNEGNTITEAHYTLTKNGAAIWKTTLEFYKTRIEAFDQLQSE